MFPALDEDLHFGYQLTGSLVVASSAEDEAFPHQLQPELPNPHSLT